MPNVRIHHVLGLAAVLLGLHLLALQDRLYFRDPLTDDAIQILGGVTAGMLGMWVLARISGLGQPSLLMVACTLTAWTFTCALAWEMGEYVRWWWFPENHVFYHNLPESLMDVAMSGTGGLALSALMLYASSRSVTSGRTPSRTGAPATPTPRVT